MAVTEQFGANIKQAQPTQGVLPQPGASMSASSDQSNGVVNYADGGDVDDTQDSGDAAPASTDPFAFIQSALSYGRQKLGLPSSFFNSQDVQVPPRPPASNNAQDTQNAMDEEGVKGGLQDDDIRAFSNNQFINNLQPDESAQWGDTTIQGKPQTMNLAEGGSVDADGDNDGDTDQGVIPDQAPAQDQQPQAPQQAQQPNPRAAMAYLQGAGAMDPATATALERHVDPNGVMDPSQRKMIALKSTGSPDKAFALMQHYRQKFNAYNAFAKAAAQGTPQKPADLRASAAAATQAYQHLPDGMSMMFQPVQGGMRVALKKIIPTKPAPSGGERRPQLAQNFAEGGAVDDDDQDQVQPDQDQGVLPTDNDPSAQAANPYGQDQPTPDQDPSNGPVKEALGGRAPHEAIRDFVLSIPQYLGWLSKGGQFDESLEKGVDTTLSDAAQQGPMNPMQTGPAVAQPQPQQSQPPMSGPARQNWPKPTPRNAEQFGATVGKAGGEEGSTLADVLHEIDQAYPFVGMSQQRALARAAARQHWMDNRTKIEAEQTKGQNAFTRAKEVAQIQAGSRNYGADQHLRGVETQQEHGDVRNRLSNTTKQNMAREKETGLNQRFQQGEIGRNDRSIMANDPSAVGNQKRIQQARQALTPQGGPAAPPRPAQQPMQGVGPVPNNPPPAGMKYQRNQDGTKWRLVPIQ